MNVLLIHMQVIVSSQTETLAQDTINALQHECTYIQVLQMYVNYGLIRTGIP